MRRVLAAVVLIVTLLVSLALNWLWPRYDYLHAAPQSISVARLSLHSAIHVDLSPRLVVLAQREGSININGPTLIRVPDWLEKPLGKCYLYLAYHKGDFIRLAYAL